MDMQNRTTAKNELTSAGQGAPGSRATVRTWVLETPKSLLGDSNRFDLPLVTRGLAWRIPGIAEEEEKSYGKQKAKSNEPAHSIGLTARAQRLA